MPEISRFYGILIKMFYNDHNPPHFHAEYGEFKAIITIDKGIVEGKMPKIALKLIFDWLDLHRDELMENWQNCKEKKKLKKIEPLI